MRNARFDSSCNPVDFYKHNLRAHGEVRLARFSPAIILRGPRVTTCRGFNRAAFGSRQVIPSYWSISRHSTCPIRHYPNPLPLYPFNPTNSRSGVTAAPTNHFLPNPPFVPGHPSFPLPFFSFHRRSLYPRFKGICAPPVSGPCSPAQGRNPRRIGLHLPQQRGSRLCRPAIFFYFCLLCYFSF